MPMGIVVISCVRPSVQPSMGLGLCIAYKALGRNGLQFGMLMYPDGLHSAFNTLVDTGDICCHYWQHILVLKPVFLPNLFALFCKYLVRSSFVMYLVRPSLTTDRLSWLLTVLRDISFAVNHRWTFRSIIDIAIDSIHIGGRIFLWITAVPCVYKISRVHRDPHACATRYLVPGTGFQNINTPGSFAETAGQNTGL